MKIDCSLVKKLIMENKIILSYSLSILLFALIYFSYWIFNPSGFIINEELNITVTDVNYPQSKSLSDKPIIIEKLSEYNKKRIDSYNEIQENKNEIDSINILISQLDNDIEKTEKELIEKLEHNRDKVEKEKTVDLYNELKSQEYNLDEIKKEINIRKKQLGESYYSVSVDDIKKEYNIRIAIAEKRLEIAIINKELSDDFLKNMSDYHDKETLKKLNILQEKRNSHYVKKSKLEDKINDINILFNDYTLNFKEKNRSRVNYVDFLYYSIGIATTTTFSDIIANNRTIRAIVMAQLIISIILLAFILKKITKQ